MAKSLEEKSRTKKNIKLALGYLVDDFVDNDKHGHFQVNFREGGITNVNLNGSLRIEDIISNLGQNSE